VIPEAAHADIVSDRKVEALFWPRNIFIVGASESGPTRAILDVLSKPSGFRDSIGEVYLINPHRKSLWGEPCFSDIESAPDQPDHVIILTRATSVADVLRRAASLGARSISVRSSDFGEGSDPEGQRRADELRQIANSSGAAVCGPNCMGHYNALTKMSGVGREAGEPGPVAIVAQSGGMLLYLRYALNDRGIYSSFGVSSGNESCLSTADYISYFSTRSDVRVILAFIEGVRDIDALLASCDRAREAGQVVICVKLGAGVRSRRAALAHTGSLVGDIQAFDAVTNGKLIRVDSSEELVDLAEYFTHTNADSLGGIAAVTYSGGLKGLLLEAAERESIEFTQLNAHTLRSLKSMLPVGTSVDNPVDTGFGGLFSPIMWKDCIDALLADDRVGTLLVQEEIPRESGIPRSEEYITFLDRRSRETGKPILLTSVAGYSMTDYGRAFKKPLLNVTAFVAPGPAMKALRQIASYLETVADAGAATVPVAEVEATEASVPADEVRKTIGGLASQGVLDEIAAKRLLSNCGLDVVKEILVTDPSELAGACQQVGYPLVIKGIPRGVLHKAQLGLVELCIADAVSAERAYARVLERAGRSKVELVGVVVAEYITSGVEVALGAHNDPEVGLVGMVGYGGEFLEQFKDISFVAARATDSTLDRAILQTHLGRKIVQRDGSRGAAALKAGLRAVCRLGEYMGDNLVSIDVNPCIFVFSSSRLVAVDANIVMNAR
jgi:acetate---CoA ligase (ADP-forming)